jgi:ankyrin repeat protein
VLWRAASFGHLVVVEALLDAGASSLGYALVQSAVGGHTDVVALLLDRGADVHYEDDNALFCVANGGHEDTVSLLLQRGATVEAYILDASLQAGHDAITDLLRAHLQVNL